MKHFIEEQQTVKVLDSITCDICGTTYDVENFIESQEFLFVDFVGGYGSIFGDMTHVKCDICQHCLKKMIDGKYRSRDYFDVFDPNYDVDE